MAAKQSTTLPADVQILGQLSDGISFIETVRAALMQDDRDAEIAFYRPCLHQGIEMLLAAIKALQEGVEVRIVCGSRARARRTHRGRKAVAQ